MWPESEQQPIIYQRPVGLISNINEAHGPAIKNCAPVNGLSPSSTATYISSVNWSRLASQNLRACHLSSHVTTESSCQGQVLSSTWLRSPGCHQHGSEEAAAQASSSEQIVVQRLHQVEDEEASCCKSSKFWRKSPCKNILRAR